ncbi:hypothetical protein PIB30_002539 [Stylosanthes scabra]|uniref:Uncharacterized protein n=1 Tax=Stylosanthes scabra TaxID=79078 RepID=A0ABU6Y216_9FABA|nr:hypothetical protein [Stylosanthes scabra]
MVNQDEEGVPYDDPSGDEQRQNPQPNPQQVDLDLNATVNGSQELGPGNSEPRPFGGIGSNPNQIMQDLRHRMQAMEHEVKELRSENTELKNVTQGLKTRGRSPRRSPPRRRERSRSHSPTKRRPRSLPRRRRHWNSSESRDSSDPPMNPMREGGYALDIIKGCETAMGHHPSTHTLPSRVGSSKSISLKVS